CPDRGSACTSFCQNDIFTSPHRALTPVYNVGMNPTHPVSAPVDAGQLPAVPLTLEGYSTLHQMMRFRWTAWRALPESQRREIAAEASTQVSSMETNEKGQSALFSLIGHKGD